MPEYRRYIKAVIHAAIMNCPVNVKDIKRVIDVWGRDAIGLKGRDVRKRPEVIGWISNVPLPPEVLERRRTTMVSVDYTFIHGLPHLHSNSRGYSFRTIEYIPKKRPTKKDSIKGVKKMLKVFGKRGIEVNQINADG